jgi:hypothetical protein
MRDRLTEFLPLLLAGVVLLVFWWSRADTVVLPFQPVPLATPTSKSVVVSSLRPTSIPLPTPALGVCSVGQPRFVGGMATLKSALGPPMGDALECERAVNNEGDTQQKTTTGLAYYRKQFNAACFTTGWEHWGLVNGGLVHWAGPSVDPPPGAAAITR